MDQLINDFFGDGYITLTCEGGECLHYTQVPGYEVNLLFDSLLCLRQDMLSAAPSKAEPYNLGRSECSRSGTHIPHRLSWYV